MWVPFVCLFIGLAFSRWLMRFSNHVMLVSLLLLLGAMGVKIGVQAEVFYNIPRLGGKALVFIAAIMIVSLVFMVIVEKLFHLHKGNEDTNLNLVRERVAEIKFMVAISLALIIGIIIGRIGDVPAIWYEKTISYSLMILFISVGMGMREGIKSLLQNRRAWLYLILPLIIMVASLIGSTIAGLLTGIPLKAALAIGGGMGYYSVTGPLVTQYAGADLGFIAFLTNFMREILTFFITPLLLRISLLMPLALGGATVMDTTLAVVRRYMGEELALAGFISGVVLTIIVPLFELFILI